MTLQQLVSNTKIIWIPGKIRLFNFGNFGIIIECDDEGTWVSSYKISHDKTVFAEAWERYLSQEVPYEKQVTADIIEQITQTTGNTYQLQKLLQYYFREYF